MTKRISFSVNDEDWEIYEEARRLAKENHMSQSRFNLMANIAYSKLIKLHKEENGL